MRITTLLIVMILLSLTLSCNKVSNSKVYPSKANTPEKSWVEYAQQPVHTSFSNPAHPQVSFRPFIVTNDNVMGLEAGSEHLEKVTLEMIQLQKEAFRTGQAKGEYVPIPVLEMGQLTTGEIPTFFYSDQAEFIEPFDPFFVDNEFIVSAKAEMISENDYVITCLSITDKHKGSIQTNYQASEELGPGFYRIDITTDTMRQIEPKKRRVLYLRNEPVRFDTKEPAK